MISSPQVEGGDNHTSNPPPDEEPRLVQVSETLQTISREQWPGHPMVTVAPSGGTHLQHTRSSPPWAPGFSFFWAATQPTLFLVNTANCQASGDRSVCCCAHRQRAVMQGGPSWHSGGAPGTIKPHTFQRIRTGCQAGTPTVSALDHSGGRDSASQPPG